jgi:hypothetical protein
MKTLQVHVDRLFGGAAVSAFALLFPALVLTRGADMRGGTGYMMGGM